MLEQVAQKGHGLSVLRDTQNAAGRSFGQLTLSGQDFFG